MAYPKNTDFVPFYPFYFSKFITAFALFFMIWLGLVFFAPDLLGHPENNIPANPLITPAHLMPEWYLMPFFSILRSVESQTLGIILMFLSSFIWLFLPWLDKRELYYKKTNPYSQNCLCPYDKRGDFFGCYCFVTPLWMGASLAAKIGSFIYFLLIFLFISPFNIKINKKIMAIPFAFLISNPANAATPIQRGFQVYQEVCSSCHGLNFIKYRDLLKLALMKPL